MEGIDVRRIAKATDGYSGADLAHVCESAAEQALLDGVRTGRRPDDRHEGPGVRRSGRCARRRAAWFDTARNVVMFADADGTYADLRAWMKKTQAL